MVVEKHRMAIDRLMVTAVLHDPKLSREAIRVGLVKRYASHTSTPMNVCTSAALDWADTNFS